MKLLLIASALITSSAFACPNLNGNYKTCKTIDGNLAAPSEFSVVQRVDTFHISSVDAETQDRQIDTYKADGKWYEREITNEDTGSVLNYSTLATCSGNELKIVSRLYRDELTVVMTKVGAKIVQKIEGVMLGQNVKAIQVCE